MFTAFSNRLIFPAPRRSYEKDSFPENLFLLPVDGAVGSSSREGRVSSSTSGAAEVWSSTTTSSGAQHDEQTGHSPPGRREQDEDYYVAAKRSTRRGSASFSTSSSSSRVLFPGIPVLFYSASKLAVSTVATVNNPGGGRGGTTVNGNRPRPKQSSSKTLLLYFHGNAEDLGMCQSFCQHVWEQFRINVCAMEYPGYGLLDKCGLHASEENVFKCAQQLLLWLKQHRVIASYEDVICMGRSIGSGPATWLCSKYPLGGLLLVSPFASIDSAVQSIANFGTSSLSHADVGAGARVKAALVGFLFKNLVFPWVTYGAAPAVASGGTTTTTGSRSSTTSTTSSLFPDRRDRFQNLLHIQNISNQPVLIIHGKLDRLIPTEHSLELFSNCRTNARKKLVTPDQMEHNSNLFANPDFFALPVLEFFQFPGYMSYNAVAIDEEFLAIKTIAKDEEMLEDAAGDHEKNDHEGFFFGACLRPFASKADRDRDREEIILCKSIVLVLWNHALQILYLRQIRITNFISHAEEICNAFIRVRYFCSS
ncbi:unnamed protein product [Amoebophrya sp. A120]|nr:unnamed protein product [Amoebophrya sp. A120]|eukprot:GSA120T00013531001.1